MEMIPLAVSIKSMLILSASLFIAASDNAASIGSLPPNST